VRAAGRGGGEGASGAGGAGGAGGAAAQQGDGPESPEARGQQVAEHLVAGMVPQSACAEAADAKLHESFEPLAQAGAEAERRARVRHASALTGLPSEQAAALLQLPAFRWSVEQLAAAYERAGDGIWEAEGLPRPAAAAPAVAPAVEATEQAAGLLAPGVAAAGGAGAGAGEGEGGCCLVCMQDFTGSWCIPADAPEPTAASETAAGPPAPSDSPDLDPDPSEEDPDAVLRVLPGLSCGHELCRDCWGGFLALKVRQRAPQCVTVRHHAASCQPPPSRPTPPPPCRRSLASPQPLPPSH
jgi:hypothetical protein